MKKSINTKLKSSLKLSKQKSLAVKDIISIEEEANFESLVCWDEVITQLKNEIFPSKRAALERLVDEVLSSLKIKNQADKIALVDFLETDLELVELINAELKICS
ncbi:MAG: hypothetical protein KDD56_01460 [Bdellovibrionales bacterium]|nr:hypothetical protein [Bdellovibrionales bacterium]